MMTRCSFMGQLQNPSILGDPHPYQLKEHCLSSEASWPNIAAHQPSKPNIRWFQLGFITVKTRAMPQRRHYYPNPLEITKRTYGSIYHKKSPLKMTPLLRPIRLDSCLCNGDMSKATAASLLMCDTSDTQTSTVCFV